VFKQCISNNYLFQIISSIYQNPIPLPHHALSIKMQESNLHSQNHHYTKNNCEETAFFTTNHIINLPIVQTPLIEGAFNTTPTHVITFN